MVATPVDEIRGKSIAVDEAFLYQRAIDQRSYVEQRDRLRGDLTLAEMGFGEAQVETLDVEGTLAAVEDIIGNAGALWLAQRERLQWLLFPRV
jgi:hypothetical protein